MTRSALDDLRFRRPIDADHPGVVAVVDDWWGGRKMRSQLPRLWFRHFAGTSWVAESGDGRLEGFLIGFVSPDDPEIAYVHLIAANPNRRKRGVGRALYEQFFGDVRSRGASRVVAVAWPGDPVAVAFHRALGFQADDGAGTQNLYGTRAYADYDGAGEDRVVFSRGL